MTGTSTAALLKHQQDRMPDPLPLDVPDGLAEDDAWWDGEIDLYDVADLLQITRNALDNRRWRKLKGTKSDPMVPPLHQRGSRWFCTRRAYHAWWVAERAKRHAELGRAARDELVDALKATIPRAEYRQLVAALANVDRMRQQSADLLALADRVETSTLAPYRP